MTPVDPATSTHAFIIIAVLAGAAGAIIFALSRHTAAIVAAVGKIPGASGAAGELGTLLSKVPGAQQLTGVPVVDNTAATAKNTEALIANTAATAAAGTVDHAAIATAVLAGAAQVMAAATGKAVAAPAKAAAAVTYDSKLYPIQNAAGVAAYEAAGSPAYDLNGYEMTDTGQPTGKTKDGGTIAVGVAPGPVDYSLGGLPIFATFGHVGQTASSTFPLTKGPGSYVFDAANNDQGAVGLSITQGGVTTSPAFGSPVSLTADPLTITLVANDNAGTQARAATDAARVASGLAPYGVASGGVKLRKVG